MKKIITFALAITLAAFAASCSSVSEPDTTEIPVITETEVPAPPQLSFGIAISNSTGLDISEVYAIDPDSGIQSPNLLLSTLYEWTSTPAQLTGSFSSNVFSIKVVYVNNGGVDIIDNVTVNDGTTIDISYDGQGNVTATSY